MEKVLRQRITKPLFSDFTLMLPVTVPQVWINSNVVRKKKVAPHSVQKTSKNKNKKASLSCQSDVLQWLVEGGSTMDLVLQQPGHHTCFLPTRSPACLPGECVQVAPADESEKKRGPGFSSQDRREREGEEGGVETLWSDKAGGGRRWGKRSGAEIYTPPGGEQRSDSL